MFASRDVFFALFDTGSSSSYVNQKTAKALGLCVEPSVSELVMAASNLQGKVLGQCIVDVITNTCMPACGWV